MLGPLLGMPFGQGQNMSLFLVGNIKIKLNQLTFYYWK